ncbi:GlcG/HbpS family heme-binding protein [Kineococcus rhizosphaerae]|uniref:Uncharacterized protein GlcG (DUF336 family) n=1 Tax=Kineococcus rhizosphaerae TaxID=559628 RepID=A0A2T0R9G9_9ACTN|nr:heme-binding protein [Kineococcus rhizosphaerae]PRY17809.1 uncharacterized protein GlcG (DUF336 family) [Kineococcus rhizosphaerae]
MGERELPTGVTGPNLELARAMVGAARRRAGELGALVSVVDAGGHLVCFERMDRAEIAGPHLATGKAATAVAHRCATADLAAASADGGALAGLSASGAGRYVVFAGGLPLWSPDGRVVAGVGVSGGSAEEDAACARAAAALWPVSPPEAGAAG